MTVCSNYQRALDGLAKAPPREASQILYEANCQAADLRSEEMARDLQDIHNVGRQTAYDILFALAELFERHREQPRAGA